MPTDFFQKMGNPHFWWGFSGDWEGGERNWGEGLKSKTSSTFVSLTSSLGGHLIIQPKNFIHIITSKFKGFHQLVNNPSRTFI